SGAAAPPGSYAPQPPHPSPRSQAHQPAERHSPPKPQAPVKPPAPPEPQTPPEPQKSREPQGPQESGVDGDEQGEDGQDERGGRAAAVDQGPARRDVASRRLGRVAAAVRVHFA